MIPRYGSRDLIHLKLPHRRCPARCGRRQRDTIGRRRPETTPPWCWSIILADAPMTLHSRRHLMAEPKRRLLRPIHSQSWQASWNSFVVDVGSA
jgi:hypothetical protein